MSEQMPMPPNIELNVNGNMLILTYDNTEVYTFDDEWFNHIYFKTDDDKRAIIFGSPEICEFLVEQGYREIRDDVPTIQDIEWFIEFHKDNLDLELYDLFDTEQ